MMLIVSHPVHSNPGYTGNNAGSHSENHLTNMQKCYYYFFAFCSREHCEMSSFERQQQKKISIIDMIVYKISAFAS